MSKQLLITSICTVLLGLAPSEAAFAAQKICINASGTLTIRTNKCPHGEKVANGTNIAAKIPGTVGTTGPQGNPGNPGTPGTNGSPGLSAREIITADASNHVFADASVYTLAATCPAPKVVLGGGCISSSVNVTTIASSPLDFFSSGYVCQFVNNTGSTKTVSVNAEAVCANVASN